MLDTLTTQNHTDFRQRYENTFGWFLPKDGPKLLVHLASVGTNGVVFKDTKGREFTIFRDSGLNFEFIQVSRGWFNGPHETYYLSRHPARQFHRGISGNNTAIYSLRKGNMQNVSCSLKVLADVFENSVSRQKAIEEFRSKARESVAISPHFCVCSNGHFFFNDRVVGRIDGDAITLNENTIRQEVGDALRRNEVPFQIVT